ncbi:hypothetical protein ACT7CZ_04325 [Bacillus cereus]
MIINKNKKRECQLGVEGTSDFSLIKGDTMQQVEELEEELKENDTCTPCLHLLYNINKRLYFFEKGRRDG